MKRALLTIAATLALLAPVTAHALPSPAFTTTATQTIGVAYTYDASATICDAPPCLYRWRWWPASRTGNGYTMATTYGTSITYAFPTPGIRYVVLTVSNSATRGGASTTRAVNVVALP